jgi:mRNA-degrading endonuclease RelE of RelBE toxin-antitoxin system
LIRRLAPDLKPLIKRAIESLQTEPYSGKELKLELAGYRSLRSRRYRVIYRLREQARVVEIHYFGPRANVYERFLQLLRTPPQTESHRPTTPTPRPPRRSRRR